VGPSSVKFSYKPLPDCLTIGQSQIDGLGLIATTNIEAGKCLGRTHISVNIRRTQEWIRTPLGGFINHSDKPNCFIVIIGNERELYTIRPINESEELTVYYSLEQPSREKH
tara:strand:+ start:446 stop:778 length:333 start_codon:yes stop_codon:yes gene_type:complete